MDILAQDLRYTLRLLRRAPTFAALVIATLAVGIGANATIFSVVDAVFLRPFPYAAPDRIVQVFENLRDKPQLHSNTSFPNLIDWRAASHTLSGIVAITGGGANLTTNGEAERVTAINVTVTFENGGVRVEILVDAEHKHNFVANDAGDDIIPTFDLAMHKMEQQIKKYKERIQDHRRGEKPVPGNEDGE